MKNTNQASILNCYNPERKIIQEWKSNGGKSKRKLLTNVKNYTINQRFDQNGVRQRVGNGANIKIWGNKWLPTPISNQVQLPIKSPQENS